MPALDVAAGDALQQRLQLQLVLADVLVTEAAALDSREFRNWLAFFTADLLYWVPIRSTRSASGAVGLRWMEGSRLEMARRL